jgi:hypothetical protein
MSSAGLFEAMRCDVRQPKGSKNRWVDRMCFFFFESSVGYRIRDGEQLRVVCGGRRVAARDRKTRENV